MAIERKRFTGKIFVLLVILSSAVFASSPPDYFPLAKGNYWVYRGKTEFLVPKEGATGEEAKTENVPRSEVLTWRMEVVDTVENHLLFAALIKGGPWDLAWYKPGKERGDYVIVRVGTFRYYLSSGEETQKLWEQLKGGAEISDKLNEGNLILDFPMAEGKVFGGDLYGLMRARYCWVVEGEHRRKGSIEYSLAYRTNPDHQFVMFKTGVGITGFTYGHHGTLSKTDLELIDFGPKEPKKKANDRSR